MVVTLEVPINLTSKTELFNYGSPTKTFVGFNFMHSMCIIYYQDTTPDGFKINNTTANYAFRVTDNGIQFFDTYMWKFFDNTVQEAYSNYIAEKELLEK